ncbi:MAG: glycosyltransferase family 2 protein [Magnetococcales bacterium]|nr:glycosyltransferase family 2 protein [Magnetococcales bacterium]
MSDLARPTFERAKFNRSVSLLSWGLNEEALVDGFLTRAIALLEETVEEFEIVFVNDGSTDRTGEILDAWAKREPRLKVIHNEKNLNVGLSCRRAVQAAGKEYLFWQTVDWSYDITNLRTFLELLNHYDVVQGVRVVPERILSHIPLIRSIYRIRGRSDNLWKAMISLGNYYTQRMLFGANFHDFQNITFYRSRAVQGLPMSGTTPFVNPEMLIRSYYGGSRFIEVPINFIPRSEGEAKGTRIGTVIRTVVDIAGNWLQWGWRLSRTPVGERGSIERVSSPFFLSDEVLRLVIPLFKDFR